MNEAFEPKDNLSRYFTGLAQSTFQTQLGVADTALVDYVSGLLIRYVRNDDFTIRGVTGRPLQDLSEMIAEATQRLGDARRKIHCQIGDFALFWAGLFPEALRRKCRYGDLDQFSDYCVQGKTAYHIAAQMNPTDENAPQSELLERLAERFELCAYGLREIRREWENEDNEGDGPRFILIN